MKKDLVNVELLEKAEAPSWWEVAVLIGGAVVATTTVVVLT